LNFAFRRPRFLALAEIGREFELVCIFASLFSNLKTENMKLSAFAILLALLISCNSEPSNTSATNTDTSNATTSKDAGTDTKSEEWVPVDSATAMNSMMEVGTPGPEHAMLAKENGNWKADVTMWMTPDGPPMTSKATMTNKMVLGGRYQQSVFKGDMMGMPFEGTSTTTYDKARKVWVTNWIDNMSTMIMNLDGTYDEGSKTTTYTGKVLCPANGKWADMKQVMKKVDDKTMVMEMYGPDMKTGKPYKSMEMKMTKS
jgi:hypothetical protein